MKSKTRAYRYEVDEAVAPYVKMIFEWKAGAEEDQFTQGGIV